MLPVEMRAISENASKEALYNIMSEQSAFDLDSLPSTEQEDQSEKQGKAREVEDIITAQGTVFPDEGLALKEHLVDIERNLIKQALSRADGKRVKNKEQPNPQRTTLIEKLISTAV